MNATNPQALLSPSSVSKLRAGTVAAVALMLAALSDPASAGSPDLYIGGSVGQGQVNATSGGEVPAPTDHFSEDKVAFKLIAGVRLLSLIGAEVEYVDFWPPNRSLGAAPADVAMKGPAAFAVLYLPVPIVDVFVKAGGARMQTTINGIAYEACPAYLSSNGTGPPCLPSVPFRIDRNDTSFACGSRCAI